MLRKLLLKGANLLVGLSLNIAQATTAGACPPFVMYQPSVPKALKKEN